MKTILKLLRNKLVIAALVIVVIAVVIGMLSSKSRGPAFETVLASTETVTEKVGVTGKVTPFQKADLGFEKGGTVAAVYRKVGDHVERGQVIASLRDEQTYASLQSSRANLVAAEAALEDSKTDTGIAYTNSRMAAINASKDAYVKSANAILNYVDTFFRGGPSVNPTLTLTAESYTIQRNLELKRYSVTEAMQKWKSDNELATPLDAEQLMEKSDRYLATMQEFIGDLSSVILNITKNGSASQTQIDSYLSALHTASADLSSAQSQITTAENNLLTAAPKSTRALEARIVQARADVSNYEAQYAKSRVTAPFAGIITKVGPQPGDVVGASQPEFSIMADMSFKVEVNVPEADIAKVAVGNKASITLDAYGETVIFSATVIAIDPAETIIEGVPTYKVTLQFDERDERVRSGMTANIDIVTASKPGVVAVPFRAVIDSNGSKVVRVPNPETDTFTEVPVTVGLKGSDGLIEIVSGIASGTPVVTFVK